MTSTRADLFHKDTARGLIENIDGVMNHLDEAKKSLDNIFSWFFQLAPGI